ARVVMKVIGREAEIQVIGTRHGEKLYETLVGREEVIRAYDEERYFRIPCDDRDLNYNKYFSSGETQVSTAEDYTSHNTIRLDVEGVVNLLRTLDMFKDYR
ncbi:MAG: polysaccharide biosynthesis protein, partial [Brevundimonas sp.]|nr:polysaccharide biosynthesis protein [Brevundimonas sp.]